MKQKCTKSQTAASALQIKEKEGSQNDFGERTSVM